MKWSEIKPSFFFLAKFLVIYLVGNILYGYWVTQYSPRPDPVTVSATHQAAAILEVFGYEINTLTHHAKAAERILLDERPVLSVYEGCNGINVWIIFIAFLVAFGGFKKTSLLFMLAGTIIIHLANLTRIVMLFFVSINYPGALYYVHKYVFTAGLYLLVFALWYFWITRYGKQPSKSA